LADPPLQVHERGEERWWVLEGDWRFRMVSHAIGPWQIGRHRWPGRVTEVRPGQVPPDARRRAESSPHPCRSNGVAPPAEMLGSTALGRPSLIRMRPLVQVQPGPQIGPVTSGNAGHCVRSASPMSCIPFGDEVFRVLPLLSRNNASEQPLSGPTAVVCLRSSVAQRCQNPSLCLGPSVGLQHGAVTAADAGSVQVTTGADGVAISGPPTGGPPSLMAIPLLLLTRDEMCRNRLRGNGPSPGQVMRGPRRMPPKLT
jgi:hypothetical protein